VSQIFRGKKMLGKVFRSFFLWSLQVVGLVILAFFAGRIAAAAGGQCVPSKPTFYNPNINDSMEGGNKTRFGEAINSVEDSIRNGRPVSIAMDYKGSFGAECNRRNRRCTLLVCSKGFSSAFPAYNNAFPNVPNNCFVGIVEDTGGAFKYKGTAKIDIATRHSRYYRSNPKGFNSVAFSKIQSPCGLTASARRCDVRKMEFESGGSNNCQQGVKLAGAGTKSRAPAATTEILAEADESNADQKLTVVSPKRRPAYSSRRSSRTNSSRPRLSRSQRRPQYYSSYSEFRAPGQSLAWNPFDNLSSP